MVAHARGAEVPSGGNILPPSQRAALARHLFETLVRLGILDQRRAEVMAAAAAHQMISSFGLLMLWNGELASTSLMSYPLKADARAQRIINGTLAEWCGDRRAFDAVRDLIRAAERLSGRQALVFDGYAAIGVAPMSAGAPLFYKTYLSPRDWAELNGADLCRLVMAAVARDPAAAGNCHQVFDPNAVGLPFDLIGVNALEGTLKEIKIYFNDHRGITVRQFLAATEAVFGDSPAVTADLALTALVERLCTCGFDLSYMTVSMAHGLDAVRSAYRHRHGVPLGELIQRLVAAGEATPDPRLALLARETDAIGMKVWFISTRQVMDRPYHKLYVDLPH